MPHVTPHARAPRVLLLAALLAAGLGAASLSAPALSGNPGRAAAVTADQYCPDAQERALLEKINAYRAKHGKRRLRLSATLGAAAEHHSRDMAETDHREHTLSDGTTALENLRDHGYRARVWGENIAWGVGWGTAAEPFAWWKRSRGHNRAMLDGDFRAIGIGRAYSADSRYGWYWTTTFGGRFDAGVGC